MADRNEDWRQSGVQSGGCDSRFVRHISLWRRAAGSCARNQRDNRFRHGSLEGQESSADPDSLVAVVSGNSGGVMTGRNRFFSMVVMVLLAAHLRAILMPDWTWAQASDCQYDR